MVTVLERAPGGVAADANARTTNVWTWAVLAVLILGVALRLWQYIGNPSIYLDEAAIARNVLDRNIAGLLTPLDYGQVAPFGFMLAVKLSSLVFGPSEYALRVTPLFFGLAGVVLFFLVAQSLLPRAAAIVATFMFATAIPLIFFTSNLKQYSGDVAVTLAVISVALRLLDEIALTRRVVVGLVALAVVALFFSQAAVFALTVSGSVVFVNAVVRNRQDKWNRVLLVCACAIAVLGAVGYGYRSKCIVDNIYMHKFWEQRFMPATPTKAANWLWTTAQAVFSGPPRPSAFDGSLHYAAPALFGSLFLLGVITVLYSEREKGILIVGPIVLALAASASGAYPVGTRVSLFLVPLVLLTVVHGIDAASRMVLRQRIGAFGCLLLLPLATQSLLEQLPPRRPEHLRPVLQYVAERWRQGDALWVYYGAGQVFEYYRRLIPISGDVQLGDCNREDPREYLRQVDVERGRSRVWMLFAHGSGPFRFDERRLLLAYLDTIGKRLDAFRAPPEDTSALVAAVFLYDLSNDQKLASARAATFPITEKYTPTRWTCYGVQSPIPERNGAATHAVMLLGSQ